jgi:hypothetical protein
MRSQTPAPVMRADLTGMRICLVHANPWQAWRPVPPYGLHRLRTALEASGAVVSIVDPYLERPEDEAEGHLTTRLRELAPELVGFSLRVVDTLVPVETTDGSDLSSDSTPLLRQIRGLVDAARRGAPEATFVVGGAAFPTAPQLLLAELGVDLGILGNGEAAVVDLAHRVRTSAPLSGVDGLVHRGCTLPVRPATAALGTTTRRDPWWAPVFSVPVRTRTGCGMFCSYCTSSNTSGVNANYSLDLVLDEIGEVVTRSREVGVVADIHFADEELNLPTEDHAVAVLQGIVDRGYAPDLRWSGYLNPRPFSDRLAELVKATHGYPEITVDSAVDSVLLANRRPVRRRHLDQLVDVLVRHEVTSVLNLMFGMPGETWETALETVAWARRVPEAVQVTWGVGVRILPGLPVAAVAATEPQHVYAGAGPSFEEPSLYCPLGPPRAVGRRLNELLGGRPNIDQIPAGESVWKSTGVLAVAYRLVAAGADVDTWVREVVDVASCAGPVSARLLKSVDLIARWNDRLDLAEATPLSAAPAPPVHR